MWSGALPDCARLPLVRSKWPRVVRDDGGGHGPQLGPLSPGISPGLRTAGALCRHDRAARRGAETLRTACRRHRDRDRRPGGRRHGALGRRHQRGHVRSCRGIAVKAAVVERPGPPSVLEIREVAEPEIGPEDVLVRVEACGVSARDVAERNGTYRRDVTYPLIMGLEISGTVVASGTAVTTVDVGDHVASKAFSSCGACRLCRNGRETTCASRRPVRGGYAEYTALPWDAWVKVPDGIPFEESCMLGPAVGVALNAVRD